MAKIRWFDPSRLEFLIAILIALVSLTTAISIWRTSIVGSSASDANRQGIIDAVKKQAASGEDWRKTYEEASYAQGYAVTLAGIDALEASGENQAKKQAANYRQYLLPSLLLLSQPLGTDQKYAKTDGTYDLDKRYADLAAESPDLFGLDPEASFQKADRFYAEQRWLTVGSVLLAISLFWLALAEISRAKFRLITMFVGIGIFGSGLLWVIGTTVFFLIMRGGAR